MLVYVELNHVDKDRLMMDVEMEIGLIEICENGLESIRPMMKMFRSIF